jgi:hypothetical protein
MATQSIKSLRANIKIPLTAAIQRELLRYIVFAGVRIQLFVPVMNQLFGVTKQTTHTGALRSEYLSSLPEGYSHCYAIHCSQ